MQATITWVCAAILIALILISLLSYLKRGSLFKKGEYGKHFINSQLKRYASQRGMTLLSDVTVSDGKESAQFDHVLIGYFGVLFLQSIQGSGSFWGDGKQDFWAFTDGSKNKIVFKNPLNEMEDKLRIFRSALSKNKIYSVPVYSNVVIVTMGQAPKMYLSNLPDENMILTENRFKPFLYDEKFDQDNKVDPEEVAKLFQK